MKKILLAITLILGFNHAIQPSFFSRAFQSVKAGLTPGNILTYTILPTLGTGVAYHFAGKEVASQLVSTEAQLAKNQAQLDVLGKGLGGLVDQINKKEPSWLDNLGTAGTIIGGTLTAYRFLQSGIGEYCSFMQILGMINMLKNGGQRPEIDEQKQQELQEQSQHQGPKKLKQAQKVQRA